MGWGGERPSMHLSPTSNSLKWVPPEISRGCLEEFCSARVSLGLFIVGREEGGVDVHLNLQRLSLNC